MSYFYHGHFKRRVFLKVRVIFGWYNSRQAQNGRQPYLFLKMEDDLNFFENRRQPQFFGTMEDNPIFFEN